jgi:hypothetical protein
MDKENWLERLCKLEDMSVGIYIKARQAARKLADYPDGVIGLKFGLNEIDEVYLDELEREGFIKVKRSAKVEMILGDNHTFFTDGKSSVNPSFKFLKFYENECVKNDLPNNTVVEPVTWGLVKTIRARSNNEEIVEYTLSNWKWLSKELKVNLPTLNVLASKFYWQRIENHFLQNKKQAENLGNRFKEGETDEKENEVVFQPAKIQHTRRN